MSFASEIKDEVVRVRARDGAVKLSELSGLTFACGNLKLGRKKAISYRTENREVGKHIAALGTALYGLEVEMEERVREHRKAAPLYVVNMSGPRAGEMLSDTGVLVTDEEGVHLLSRLPEGLVREEEARHAFVRGCFLGAGSCSDPQGEYSLEILCRAEGFAVGLCNLLNEYGLTARYALRRNRYVVYLKDGDSITGFLALIGSSMAALDLENVRAEKETRNYVNRTTNCEYANLDKLVAASVKQQQAVNTILRHGHFQRLPKALKEAAELRLNYPDASLQELADMADIKKSGMNHRLTRLIEYAQDLENGLI
ncbi:MAG: DNA-binding protein WhiA [Clostridia bacterium]|nr:DNA-binding protein WhiA [Clostridia bacterium]MBR0421013.1 DNA-binding protein WhiA [Clostridia bacterium]